SRSLAEQKLAELLLAGRPADELSGHADEDAGKRWTVTSKAPQAMDPESYLERRFRQVLRERLERANIDVEDKPGPTGTEMSVQRTGARVAWGVVPQVPLGRTEAGVLVIGDGIPDIAIYTGGRAIHGSSAVHRLADDAAKRSWVRSQ